MTRQKNIHIYCILAFMLILPLALLLLPKSYFDHGPTLCLFTLLTGSNCPGCGMTRACMRLIHLDFRGAWEFNKMSFVVFPTLVYIYIRYFVSKIKKLNPREQVD